MFGIKRDPERPVCRRMRASDLDFVVENEELSYPNPWSRRIFLDWLRAGYECWVLATRDRILAHGVLSVTVGEGHLLTLCVHPAQRRKAYGRRMLEHLLKEARRLDAEFCYLEVRPSNTAARMLYYSLGFVQVGERRHYYPAERGSTVREDALLLCSDLR